MEENKKENALYKKWWFWLIIVILILIIIFSILKIKEQRMLNRKMETVAESASNFISSTKDVKSHLDEFSYNYETGQTEYKPLITIEKYNNIKEGMNEEEVVLLLGNYDKKSDGENTYMLEWGNAYSPAYNGYWIQIVFDMRNRVSRKYQVGLK